MNDRASSLYNLSLLKEQYGGSEELIRRMTELFVANTPVSVSELRKAAAARDWDSVRALAHKIKSSLDLMGVEVLHEKVRETERSAAAREQLDELPDKLEYLCKTLEAVVEEIRRDFSL